MADGGTSAPGPTPADPGLTTEPVDDPGQLEAADTDRILTIPNVVSVVRLCCIPLFLWLLFGVEDRSSAAYLLAVLGATDWVDGYVARHFHQVSTLGKVLDPTADRLLLAVGVVAIAVDGSVPIWIAVLTIARETLVGGATLVLAALGARRIDVTWFGKAGTFGLLCAYPLFLGSHAEDLGWEDLAGVLAWVCVIPGLIFSYIAAAGYVPLARRALAEGRAR
ncbi:MAG: phosphatidylglycerophosphate synthase [Acidimicrobiales bacterium]|jgi:cardiolipin synthase|nr:phosphatidylglycerophosphate synthase [Acidimicrobiales bacterium]